jgi:hypothetical protein
MTSIGPTRIRQFRIFGYACDPCQPIPEGAPHDFDEKLRDLRPFDGPGRVTWIDRSVYHMEPEDTSRIARRSAEAQVL